LCFGFFFALWTATVVVWGGVDWVVPAPPQPASATATTRAMLMKSVRLKDPILLVANTLSEPE
jgi:hypothetical protein